MNLNPTALLVSLTFLYLTLGREIKTNEQHQDNVGNNSLNKTVNLTNNKRSNNSTIKNTSKPPLTKKDIFTFNKVLSHLIKTLQQESKNGKKQKKNPTGRDFNDYIIYNTDFPDENLLSHDITLSSLLYKEPGHWSRCTRSCRTSRMRKCRIAMLCTVDVLMEEAYCYFPGSKCEKKVKALLKEKEKQINDEEKINHIQSENKEDDEEEYYSNSYAANNDFDAHLSEHGGLNYDYGTDYGIHDFIDYNIIDEGIDDLNNDWIFGDTYEYYTQYPEIIKEYDEKVDEDYKHYQELASEYQEKLDDEYGTAKDSKEEEHKPTQHSLVGVKSHNSNECGRSTVSAPSRFFRIIGGKEAVIGAWPWQVAILNKYKETHCGGTLIGSEWILTASHCVRKTLYVKIGAHDINLWSMEKYIELKVKKSYRNPHFDEDTYDGDIALLKLYKNPFKNSPSLRPACLPSSSSKLKKSDECVVLGWGKERESHIFGSDVLRYAKVPVVSQKSCRRAYSDHDITPNMICAGYLTGGPDACAGDSGGPLLCQSNKQEAWTIYGVTSFGDGCGEKGRVGVYVKVSNYLSWINNIMKTK